MFRRKLQALDFVQPEIFDVNDESHFRNMVVWLEDQKIRFYKIEDRAALRNLNDVGKWTEAFEKYLKDLQFPYDFKSTEKAAIMDWLCGFAIRLEFADNRQKYQNSAEILEEISKAKAPGGGAGAAAPSANPLDKLNLDDEESIKGVLKLAEILKIPLHPDHRKVLEAITKLVQARISNAKIQEFKEKQENSTSKNQRENSASTSEFHFDKIPIGTTSGDPIMDSAIRILRLLHVQEMRYLQTKINETIVEVQKVTANPKTDDRLGKVGR